MFFSTTSPSTPHLFSAPTQSQRARILLTLVVLAVAAVPAARGQAPLEAWVSQASGPGNVLGLDVALGPDGSATVTGRFEGTADFSGTTLTSQGLFDLFVARYTPSGVLEWAIQAGGTGDDWGLGIAVGPDGSATVTGLFEGTADFSGTTLTSEGMFDIFIARYTPSGALDWVRQAGGTGFDEGGGVAVGSDGSAIVTGTFSGAVDFSGTTLTSLGTLDFFVAHYTSSGALDWVRQAGSSSFVQGLGVAVGPDGSVTATGWFRDSADFSGTVLTSQGADDMFVARYTSSGALDWVRQAGGLFDDRGRSIAIGPDGSATVMGVFGGTALFSGTVLTNQGGGAAFIARYTPSGALDWVRQVNGSSLFQSYGVGVGPDGSATITGYFRRTADFGGTVLTSFTRDFDDMFVARYTSSGALAWVRQVSGPSFVQGRGVAVGPDGHTTVTGYFSETADFGGTALTSQGGNDLFVARYEPTQNPTFLFGGLNTFAFTLTVVAQHGADPNGLTFAVFDGASGLVTSATPLSITPDADGFFDLTLPAPTPDPGGAALIRAGVPVTAGVTRIDDLDTPDSRTDRTSDIVFSVVFNSSPFFVLPFPAQPGEVRPSASPAVLAALGPQLLSLAGEDIEGLEGEASEVPEAVTVEAAYPNPFRAQTAIAYSLPEAAEVRLAVYDLLGREVAVLAEGTAEAGRHVARFEAASLPTGLYVYRLETAGQTRTGRLMLVR